MLAECAGDDVDSDILIESVALSDRAAADYAASDQQKRVMALNLVIAAIVYWNTLYMDKATDHQRQQGRLPEPHVRQAPPLAAGAAGALVLSLAGTSETRR